MIVSLLLVIFTIFPSWAKQRTIEEAIVGINPNCQLKKEIIYLTKKQKKQIEELAQQKLYSGIIHRYQCNKKISYVDSHIVRTLNETVILEVEESKLKNLELVSFYEPPEYKPPRKWMNSFHGKKLDKSLQLYKGIDGLSGATLTAIAITNATRKILALDKVLNEQSI